MSKVEETLNALEGQPLYSVTTEDTNQQQDMDNNSEGTLSSTEFIEYSQPPAPLSSMDSSTISSASTLDYNYESSNSSTISAFESTDYDTPFINPISFLNTMHQKLKSSDAPTYEFSHDSATGQFYCQVNFYGQAYKNDIARPKKQQAKEDAASIAMKDLSLLMPDVTASIRQELIRAHISASQKARNNNKNKNNNQTNNHYHSRQASYHQQIVGPHPLEYTPKSQQWLERQTGQTKRPCVLLLEFCQMHRLGHPTYKIRDDGRGCYLFDCTVYNRTFTPEMAFWQKSEAKDHVSLIAFDVLYREFRDKEQLEIQRRLQPYGIPPSVGMPPSHPPNIAYPQLLPLSIYPNTADGSNYYNNYNTTTDHASYYTNPNGYMTMCYSNTTTNASVVSSVIPLQRN